MGNGVTKDENTKQIDQNLRKEKLGSSQQIRLLLLGSGESGKSTLVRQMKLLKTDGYTDEERFYFRNHICFNLVEWTLLLAENLASAEGISSEDIELLKQWREGQSSRATFAAEVVQAIRNIQSTPEEQKKNALLELQDSASYFFEHAERVMGEKYVPTGDDIVRCRITTSGVHELNFNVGKYAFTIIDVGGQRGQRKKWIHVFDDINGMVFVTALSDYDKKLVEDGSTNRLQDSLCLWEEVVCWPAFKELPTILFFNKNDKFEEKIDRVPLSVCFPDYECTGDPSTSAREYIEHAFLSRAAKGKHIFTHFTTATDKSNVERVMQLTMDILLSKSLNSAGL